MAENTRFQAAAYTARGTQREAVTLPDTLFDGTINVPVMHQAVKAYLANQRQGNAKAEIPTYNVGDTITVGVFQPGETVKVTGTTKGRGFQGVVKRHGFGGGPNTHGNTKHRRPGSIGPGTDPARVIKGKKMPGHYGAERHTQTHLRVEKVDAERNLIYIRGSVAGPSNGIVLVRKQG